jgi:dienelactone hydrolase
MKFKFRYFMIGLAVILLAVIVGFVVWAMNGFGPGDQALAALEADAQVDVSEDDSAVIMFEPTDSQTYTGFVFYPGGRVDYRSYAPALREIASEGYLVALVPAPLNLMVFDIDAADAVISQFPQTEHWAVGGHSLGGAMAASYLYSNPGMADGLILWASYPAESNNLSGSGLKVLSIYGTLDMAGMDKFEASRALLPVNTTWVIIEGGNHAQFGDYGFQPGDNISTISAADQQAQIVSATVEFLDSLGE